MGAFGDILNYICVFFDWIIYEIASLCYVLFATICEMDASVIGQGFEALMGRIKVFLGVIMLFIVAFNLLKMLIDPATVERASSAMVKKIAITVILLVSSTFIFETLDKFQKDIISENRIERIITGAEGSTSDEGGLIKYVKTGKFFAYNLFFSFVNIEDNLKEEIMGAKNNKTLWDAVGVINDTSTTYRYPIISGAVGILLAVMFISFAIDIGTRAFTLILLQVVSPIPIIMYITPKGDQMLSKYMKTYIGIYIELFVKIALAYIMLYLMQMCMAAILKDIDVGGGVVPSLFPNLGDNASDIFRVLLFVIIMVAIFMFVKKLPKMLSDMFGINFSGGAIDPFKVTGNILKTGGALALGAGGMALGAGIGALGTIGTGASAKEVARAALGGAGRGAKSGYDFKNSRNIKDVISKGYTATRDNFRTSRTNTQSLLDQGGVDGVRAARENKENERIIAEANRNLETINKGEELRKQMIESSELAYLKTNGFNSKDEYVQHVIDTNTGYVGAVANLEAARHSGNAANINSAMLQVQRAKGAARTNALNTIKTGGASGLAADIAAGMNGATNDRYANFVNYQNHISSNTDIYKDNAGNPLTINPTQLDTVHNSLDGVNGIRTKENQKIINANSNPTAIAAGQAQARGAAHAASRGNTKK